MENILVETHFLHSGAIIRVNGRLGTYVVARRLSRGLIPQELSNRGGAYLLLSDPDAKGVRIAYVGQSAEATGTRLASHDRQKAWWRTFVDVTPRGDQISRDLSASLERKLHDALEDSVGLTLDNQGRPPTGLSELQGEIADGVIDELRIILKGLLDLDLLADAQGSSSESFPDITDIAEDDPELVEPFVPAAAAAAANPLTTATRTIEYASVPAWCSLDDQRFRPSDWTSIWTWTIETAAGKAGSDAVREWLLTYHERTPRVRQPLASQDLASFTRSGTRESLLGIVVGTNFSAEDLLRLSSTLASHFGMTFRTSSDVPSSSNAAGHASPQREPLDSSPSALQQLVLEVASKQFRHESFRRNTLMDAVERHMRENGMWTPAHDEPTKSSSGRGRGMVAIDWAISALKQQGRLDNVAHGVWRLPPG